MGIDPELIQNNIGEETFEFIHSKIDMNQKSMFLSTNSIFNFQQIYEGYIYCHAKGYCFL